MFASHILVTSSPRVSRLGSALLALLLAVMTPPSAHAGQGAAAPPKPAPSSQVDGKATAQFSKAGSPGAKPAWVDCKVGDNAKGKFGTDSKGQLTMKNGGGQKTWNYNDEMPKGTLLSLQYVAEKPGTAGATEYEAVSETWKVVGKDANGVICWELVATSQHVSVGGEVDGQFDGQFDDGLGGLAGDGGEIIGGGDGNGSRGGLPGDSTAVSLPEGYERVEDLVDCEDSTQSYQVGQDSQGDYAISGPGFGGEATHSITPLEDGGSVESWTLSGSDGEVNTISKTFDASCNCTGYEYTQSVDGVQVQSKRLCPAL